MDISDSSVWCSSAGQNVAGPRYSSEVKFQPMCPKRGETVTMDKARKEKTRFVLLGLETYPFFTSLETEQKADLLLSFATFQAADSF